MGYLKNIPVESIESDMPILITRYALREGSGSPGRWRGGVGVEMGFKVFRTQATITSRGMERYRFAPWGREGGAPGTPGQTTVDPGRPSETDIGKIDVLTLDPGQELLVKTQGGGGFGSPLDRDPSEVLRDVAEELVSVESAERDYGVVIRDGAVDEAATAARRAELRAAAPAPSRFSYCANRAAYDDCWGAEMRAHLNAITSVFPGSLRHSVRASLMAEIDARYAAGEPVSPDVISAHFERLMHQMGWEPAEITAARG